jgi:hypothetical protein
MDEEYQVPKKRSLSVRLRRFLRILWLITEHLFDLFLDALGGYGRIMRRESELFFGMGLVLIGFLNFQNGKNCDGNSADYLACTRPSTFYYYSWVEITLIVLGTFLILLWLLRLQERRTPRQ